MRHWWYLSDFLITHVSGSLHCWWRSPYSYVANALIMVSDQFFYHTSFRLICYGNSMRVIRNVMQENLKALSPQWPVVRDTHKKTVFSGAQRPNRLTSAYTMSNVVRCLAIQCSLVISHSAVDQPGCPVLYFMKSIFNGDLEYLKTVTTMTRQQDTVTDVSWKFCPRFTALVIYVTWHRRDRPSLWIIW